MDECRYCHDSTQPLVKICSCKGSISHVHLKCAQIWLRKKRNTFCELCQEEYNLKPPSFLRFGRALLSELITKELMISRKIYDFFLFFFFLIYPFFIQILEGKTNEKVVDSFYIQQGIWSFFALSHFMKNLRLNIDDEKLFELLIQASLSFLFRCFSAYINNIRFSSLIAGLLVFDFLLLTPIMIVAFFRTIFIEGYQNLKKKYNKVYFSQIELIPIPE